MHENDKLTKISRFFSAGELLKRHRRVRISSKSLKLTHTERNSRCRHGSGNFSGKAPTAKYWSKRMQKKENSMNKLKFAYGESMKPQNILPLKSNSEF